MNSATKLTWHYGKLTSITINALTTLHCSQCWIWVFAGELKVRDLGDGSPQWGPLFPGKGSWRQSWSILTYTKHYFVHNLQLRSWNLYYIIVFTEFDAVELQTAVEFKPVRDQFPLHYQACDQLASSSATSSRAVRKLNLVANWSATG